MLHPLCKCRNKTAKSTEVECKATRQANRKLVAPTDGGRCTRKLTLQDLSWKTLGSLSTWRMPSGLELAFTIAFCRQIKPDSSTQQRQIWIFWQNSRRSSIAKDTLSCCSQHRRTLKNIGVSSSSNGERILFCGRTSNKVCQSTSSTATSSISRLWSTSYQQIEFWSQTLRIIFAAAESTISSRFVLPI